MTTMTGMCSTAASLSSNNFERFYIRFVWLEDMTMHKTHDTNLHSELVKWTQLSSNMYIYNIIIEADFTLGANEQSNTI